MSSLYAPVVTYLASFLLWLMVFVFLVLAPKTFPKNKIAGLILSVIVAWGISIVFKDFFPSARPFQINGYPALTITVPSSAAFPSTHTAIAFALASYVYLVNKKTGVWFLVLAVLVGVGRLLSQVHFPVDVLGGVAVGAGSAIFFYSSKIKT